MIEITAEVRAAIDRAAGDMEPTGDEYIEPADGLIHCKKCHGSRQTVVPRFGGSGYFMPRCLCPCQQKAQEERKAMEEQRERMERVKRRKAQGLQDRYLYDYTFANDNGQNPVIKKSRTRQTLPTQGFMTAYWNGVRRFFFPVKISGRKEPERPKRRRKRL